MRGAMLRTSLQVLVVSEVDRVHPVLYPLLRRDLQKQAGRLVRMVCAEFIAVALGWIRVA